VRSKREMTNEESEKRVISGKMVWGKKKVTGPLGLDSSCASHRQESR
jgi:hypothetical protein